MSNDQVLLDWIKVNKSIICYKKTTDSLKKSMVRSIKSYSLEMQFVIAYYEKEEKNRLSWQLMDYLVVNNCEIEEPVLSDFSEMIMTGSGKNIGKPSEYCAKSRFEYEKKIIQEILRSQLEFKNIANEFTYNFFNFLIKTEQTLLAVQFKNDKFSVCYDLMKKKEIYDFKFYQTNFNFYKKYVCDNESLLTDYDKNIIKKFQKMIYVCFFSKIENEDFSFFPLLSTDKLKDNLLKRKCTDSFHILVNRHISIYGYDDGPDWPMEIFLLENLFDLWETKKIKNQSNLYFKISERAFYDFINRNKLIPRQIFTFFSFFKGLVPWSVLNKSDTSLIPQMDVLLQKMTHIQKPLGTFEEITIKTDHIDELLETNSFLKNDLSCSIEKLYPHILRFQCVYRNTKDSFNPFNYTFPVAVQIYEKLKIDSSKYQKIVAFGKGINIETYIKINERMGYEVRGIEDDNSPAYDDNLSYNEYSFTFLNLNIKYKTIFEEKKGFGMNILIEQSLQHHPPQILRKFVHFSVSLGASIFKYLKINNFDYLKELCSDFLETTTSLLSYPDRNLFHLLRTCRIDLEDLKPNLIYDLDFTIFKPKELIGLFDGEWADRGCKQCGKKSNSGEKMKKCNIDIIENKYKDVNITQDKSTVFDTKIIKTSENKPTTYETNPIKNSNSVIDKNIDPNLKRVLLQFTTQEDHLVAIRYFLYKSVPEIHEYVIMGDILYEYLKNRMIKDQCCLSNQDLSKVSMSNSDTFLFYQVLSANPKFIFRFLEEINEDTCTLKDAVLACALKKEFEAFLDKFDSEKEQYEVEDAEEESFNSSSGSELKKSFDLSLEEYRSLIQKNAFKEANLYYKAIFQDPWRLLFPSNEYNIDDSIFQSELFYTLSCVRPRDIHPYIPSLAILDHKTLNIHLRDKYFSFVHSREIEKFFEMSMKKFDTESEYLELEKVLLLLRHVHNIKVSQLVSLYHHQNNKISQLARSRLYSLELANPDVNKVKTKILNFLLDKPNTSASFINDMTFYYNLDAKSIELLIELIKKSKDSRLIECLIRICKHSHLNFYLADLLNVSDNPVSIVDELQYVIKKDVVCDWIKKKLSKKCSGMTAVYIHSDIVDIMDIMKIPFEDVYSFEQQSANGSENRSSQSDISEFVVPFFVTSSVINSHRLSQNVEFYTLFYFSTYAPKIKSFHKHIKIILPALFAEFLSDNSISFISLKNIIKYTNQFDEIILTFLWKHIGVLSVTNKLEMVKFLEIIFHSKDILQDSDSKNIIPLSMLCTLILRNDNNSNVQKEFSKFSGSIHGTKIIKSHFREIFTLLNSTLGSHPQERVSETSFHENEACIKYSSTITKPQFNRIIDDFIEKYPKDLQSQIDHHTDNRVLLRCLKYKFLIEDVMKIILDDKRKIITDLDENIVGKYLLTNNVEHSVYEIFSDDLIVKKILSGEYKLFKYLRNKGMLYVEILQKFYEIRRESQVETYSQMEISTKIEKSDIFKLYQMIKCELISKAISNQNIEKSLLKIGYTPLIIDLLEYSPKIDDCGHLRDLIEFILSQRQDDSMIKTCKNNYENGVLQLIVRKIDISLVKLIQDIPLDMFIDKLSVSDVNLVRNRLKEIKHHEKCVIWLLKSNFRVENRGIVQFCLEKVLPQLDGSTNQTHKILLSYSKSLSKK